MEQLAIVGKSAMNRRVFMAGAALIASSGARAQPLPVFSDTVPQRLGPGPLSSAGAPSLNLDFMSTPGTLDPRITFTRGSTATYFDATGTMQTVSGNTPRWDYDPLTYVLRGLLIEEARTNLLLNSATLGTQSVTVTAQAYTLSFYGTGTITKSGAATGALVGTGAFPQRVSQTFTPSAGSLTVTVTGSVLNAQLEAGGFVTSWVPTTAAAATRAQDRTVISNMSWMLPSIGSWFAEFIYNDPASNNARIIATAQGSGAGSPLLVEVGRQLGLFDGGLLGTANATTMGAVTKGTSTYNGTTDKICANAGPVASVSGPGLTPPLIVFMQPDPSPSADNITGYIRRVRYWPRVLSNFEMQSVTT